MTLISILNHPNESVLGYSLVRLVGKVLSGSAQTLTIIQDPGNKKTKWEIKGGYFKALILLKEGANHLKLLCDTDEEKSPPPLQWTLTYDSSLINTTEYTSRNIQRVRPVYVYCRDHDGSFHTMKDGKTGGNDLSAAIRKMQIAALLLQTFCAEALKSQKTFALEVDKTDSSLPHVTVLQLKHWKREDLASLSNDWEQDGGFAGYNALLSELNEYDQNNSSVVYFAILGGSFYNPVTKKTRMATALGGGKLGLFADVALHTYPSSVDEIVACWQDSRRVDVNQVRDDSCGRGTFWANFATCLGASMHEVGHCFGCPHTPGVFTGVSKCMNNTCSINESSLNNECFSSRIQQDSSSLKDAHYYVIGPDVINRSSFENVRGKEWLERHGDRPFATFTEQSRNEEEIMLFDSGRNMLLRLTMTMVHWKMNNPEAVTWNFLGNGYPLFLSNPDHKKIIEAHCCVIRND
ncbi:hypothetical protein C9374_013742 [Naegleria lovaniensis]|uniref:Zinc metalloproteinase n=1 Tax=Naegleria lovaniensis TaxID=51637 RepID=A0AA88G9A5_NAELO|nr:uncharacterized protein C9374_013742 [Naegleria lovaniensis]KAG2370907.1 hypothetical protein C9374_013742 [Naegleria lovaniensis]